MSTALSQESSSRTDDWNNSSAESVDTAPNEIQIQSRLSMSEEQREIRRQFDEKQREEARRSAQVEKKAKKKVCGILFC